MKYLEQTHAAANLEPVRLGQSPRMVVVEQHDIGKDFFPKKNCAELSSAERKPPLGCQEASSILKRFHLNPCRIRDFRCSRQARASDDHFVMDFGRNVNSRI